MGSTRLRAPLVSLAALLAAGGAIAGAQSGPAPTPGCAGLAAEDPPNDAERYEGQTDAPDNFDITGVFFTHAGGRTYAHMQTQAGGSQLPPGATGARWYIFFKADQDRFVRASINNNGAPTFDFGHAQPNETGTSYVSDGATTGTFFTGTPGVLRIEVPADLGKPGATLGSPSAQTFDVVGVTTPAGGRNQLFEIDIAPDSGAGEDYAVNACESGGGGGGGGGTPQPPSPPAPPSPPSGGGGGGSAGSGGGGGPAQPAAAPSESPAQPGTLAIRLTKTSAKAKGRTLRLALTSTGTVSGLKATLLAGAPRKPKVVGRGSLARVAKKGTLRLKLSRKLKKGRYLLALTGTNPDGRGATLSVSLRLR